jgi:hypothetical protein
VDRGQVQQHFRQGDEWIFYPTISLQPTKPVSKGLGMAKPEHALIMNPEGLSFVAVRPAKAG